MHAEDPTPPLPAPASGPAIVCFDEAPGRTTATLATVRALVAKLGGSIASEEVTGMTHVVRARLEQATAPRFQSALALAGATFLSPMAAQVPCDFVVIINRCGSSASGGKGIST